MFVIVGDQIKQGEKYRIYLVNEEKNYNYHNDAESTIDGMVSSTLFKSEDEEGLKGTYTVYISDMNDNLLGHTEFTYQGKTATASAETSSDSDREKVNNDKSNKEKQENNREITKDIEFTTDMDNLFDDLKNNLVSYEFVDSEWYTDVLGNDELLLLFKAQKDNRAISIERIVTDSSGNIIDKGDDDASVSSGHLGLITMYRDKDKYGGKDDLKYKFTVKEYTPFLNLGSDHFEVENYNLSGDNLYITLKAYESDVNSLSGIGALFYKNGNLVYYDHTYPDDWDENGEAVCSMWLYGEKKDFDDIIFYYE